MNFRIFLPFLLMMTIGSVFAADIEMQVKEGQEQGEGNEENTCGLWRMIKNGGHYVFEQLGSQRGAVILGVSYALEQAVGNFLWGFNWAEHAGASDNAHMIIQETGAMLVVAGCVVAGALIPVAVYSYNKKHPNPPEEGN